MSDAGYTADGGLAAGRLLTTETTPLRRKYAGNKRESFYSVINYYADSLNTISDLTVLTGRLYESHIPNTLDDM